MRVLRVRPVRVRPVMSVFEGSPMMVRDERVYVAHIAIALSERAPVTDQEIVRAILLWRAISTMAGELAWQPRMRREVGDGSR
jgi:hypothetical protein